jgi:penicillin amidase
MKIKDKEIVLTGTEGKVTIKRMDCGFPRIEAEKEIDLHYALGYIHAYDRQMQMWLLKMIGTGRSSEFIGGYAELVELDKFMRWIKLDVDATEEVGRLSSEVAKIFEVYCRGVNDAVAASRIPYEFRLVGYKADRWSPEDVVLMVKLFGFMGLSQSQGDMEKFILQIIRNDIEPRKIKELFPYIREEISDALIAIIKQIKFVNPVVPESVKWLAGLPGFSASNNWAVGPQKTASGEAILCGDPHLTLQLPSIWYHAVMISENHFMMGATLPGIPSIILGRSANLAWAVTYGTMDMTDYFIEEVRDKKYRRGENWFSFSVREEIIRPKKKEPIVLRIYENDCGLLEGEPEKDGYYLNLAWSARKGTVAETAANFLKLPHVKTTQEAMRCFAGLPFAPFNWVMADARGNIGYQLSGLYPQKPQNTSGLLPYLAWDENQAWQGMIDPRKYPRAFNPKEGYIITANQDLNHLGEVEPMTLPMSSYRADRIGELLESATSLTADDMKKMQYDLYSRQARTFMEIIQPLLPETENGELLKTGIENTTPHPWVPPCLKGSIWSF